MARTRPRRGPPSNTATVISFSDLPSAAQQKGRGQGAQNFGKSMRDLSRDDLSASQRNDAASTDIVIIQDGDADIILSPTGDAIQAIQLAVAART